MYLRLYKSWFVALVTLLALSGVSHAQSRVALVIGNGAYAHAAPLENPPNDAGAMAALFGRLAFATTKLENASISTMRAALNDFGRRARGAEMVAVFFAGHGMEFDGENWLIATDARLKSEADAAREAIALKDVLQVAESAGKLGLVMLDACRNSPFETTSRGTTRAVDRGFVRVGPQANVLVAYAAKDGTTAADGAGRNSPFTAALLKHLETPRTRYPIRLPPRAR